MPFADSTNVLNYAVFNNANIFLYPNSININVILFIIIMIIITINYLFAHISVD